MMNANDFARLQHELARALTDRAALQSCCDQPGPSVQTPQVNGSDALAQISPEELHRGAQTLVRKRLSQTRALMPGTSWAMGESFSVEFLAFCSTRRFQGHHAPLLDAIYFGEWLRHRLGTPDWIGDLALWESTWKRMVVNRLCLRLVRLNYDVVDWLRGNLSQTLSANTEQGKIRPPSRKQSCWLVWRWSDRARSLRIW